MSSTDARGGLTALVTVPLDPTVGMQKVKVTGMVPRQRAKAPFTVT
jgi:hypothetical protein